MSNFELSSPQSYVNQEQATQVPNHEQKFVVQFWGVRGLIPTPGSNTCHYGGNTACVEMQLANKRLIFDGGTGLRVLGKSWLKQQQPIEAHLFLLTPNQIVSKDSHSLPQHLFRKIVFISMEQQPQMELR